ncbi:hypothetical protein EV426DRAFT_671714 [Tirmania nivea]|nr:hypothetical protein EV426DRAFT_671714 [Tirmania nivea]
MPSAWVMETCEALLLLVSFSIYPQDGGAEEDSFDVEVISESSSDDPASISESPVSSAFVMASARASPTIGYLRLHVHETPTLYNIVTLTSGQSQLNTQYPLFQFSVPPITFPTSLPATIGRQLSL